MIDHREEEKEQELQERRDKLRQMAVEIMATPVAYSQEYRDLAWLWSNRKKIVRNKGVIELIG